MWRKSICAAPGLSFGTDTLTPSVSCVGAADWGLSPAPQPETTGAMATAPAMASTTIRRLFRITAAVSSRNIR